VQSNDKKNGKKHEVWKDSFDVKECRTEKFILQKLTYIHNNPWPESGNWQHSHINTSTVPPYFICGANIVATRS